MMTCRLPSGQNLKIILWKKPLCREKQKQQLKEPVLLGARQAEPDFKYIRKTSCFR